MGQYTVLNGIIWITGAVGILEKDLPECRAHMWWDACSGPIVGSLICGGMLAMGLLWVHSYVVGCLAMGLIWVPSMEECSECRIGTLEYAVDRVKNQTSVRIQIQ